MSERRERAKELGLPLLQIAEWEDPDQDQSIYVACERCETVMRHGEAYVDISKIEHGERLSDFYCPTCAHAMQARGELANGYNAKEGQ